MRIARVVAPCLVLVAAIGCTIATREPAPQPKPQSARRAAPTALNIPPGHYPPAGRCRVWLPGTPPGRQAAPRSCSGIERHAPAGSLVLYRPAKDRRVLHVRQIDERRSGVVVYVRIYDARRGTYLRDG